jgi:hypothetical protein
MDQSCSGYKSIALVICYFGKLPWYFHYFVHSCKFNPTVDFFVLTDDRTWPGELPLNVKLICTTINEINILAEEKLGIDVCITSGYKLCDFKPAYGVIFSHLVEGYDFWGHCDIDIIFGDIRSFITDEMLTEHDLISVRHDWLSGCFLLYRNTGKLNRLFEHSKDYKKVFAGSEHFCFDETNFAHDAFTSGRYYKEIETDIESMTHVVKRLEEESYIKPFFDFYIIEGLPGRLKWTNGHLFYRNKYEVLFYHLIYFKKHYNRSRKPIVIPDTFNISALKIYRPQPVRVIN